jgi:hypothetical protein
MLFLAPPPATMNSSAPAKTSGNIPLAPPPPPPNLCKATSGDKPLTMADQIKKQQLRKTDTNGGLSFYSIQAFYSFNLSI